jgi:hypothetical protein
VKVFVEGEYLAISEDLPQMAVGSAFAEANLKHRTFEMLNQACRRVNTGVLGGQTSDHAFESVHGVPSDTVLRRLQAMP